jgi:hypothetical protein
MTTRWARIASEDSKASLRKAKTGTSKRPFNYRDPANSTMAHGPRGRGRSKR